MKCFLIGLIVIVILAGGYLFFMYSGMYNISARVPHNSLTMWMINTVRDNSIKHNSDSKIKFPNLSDSSLIKTGFVHYSEMCVSCHGGPGIQRDEIGEGLYPKAPMLSRVVKDWTPQQLFWITKNGIKMTGMPSFGVTHPDDKIWAIVAFIQKLPTMTEEQYQAFDNSSKNESDESEHHH